MSGKLVWWSRALRQVVPTLNDIERAIKHYPAYGRILLARTHGSRCD